MALLRSLRFSHAVTACGLGLVACGVSLALAGPTPRPPASPVDSLPPGVKQIDMHFECSESLVVAATPTQPPEDDGLPTTTSPTKCWTFSFVSAPDATANELADRLALHYTAKGFEFAMSTDPDSRSFLGRSKVCGTILALDTGLQGANLPPGFRATLPNASAPFGTPTTTTTTVPGEPLPGSGIAGEGIGASDPSLTGPMASDGVTPSSSAPGVGMDSTQPNSLATLYDMVSTNKKGGAVVVSVQHPRAVVPRQLEDRC